MIIFILQICQRQKSNLSFSLLHRVNRMFGFLPPRQDFPIIFKSLITGAPLFRLYCQVVLEPTSRSPGVLCPSLLFAIFNLLNILDNVPFFVRRNKAFIILVDLCNWFNCCNAAQLTASNSFEIFETSFRVNI